MLKNQVIIFANPIAGKGRGKLAAQALESSLTTEGFAVTTFFDRPTDIPVSVFESPMTAAITIGGDGTLRGVVDRYITTGHRVPPMIPISMGTANLMGKHLGISFPPNHMPMMVTDMIRRQKTISLDAGLANNRLFLLMAGVGIDAQVVHLLDRMRRGPIDLTSYILPAAMAFASYGFPPITVRVDDQLLLEHSPAIALIGNVKEYGTGFPILTQARPDDGLLDVCIMPCRNRLQLVEILLLIAAGEHRFREAVIYTRGKTIHVDAEQPTAVQIDGDSSGFTPLDIKVLPACVPFLLPV